MDGIPLRKKGVRKEVQYDVPLTGLIDGIGQSVSQSYCNRELLYSIRFDSIRMGYNQ